MKITSNKITATQITLIRNTNIKPLTHKTNTTPPLSHPFDNDIMRHQFIELKVATEQIISILGETMTELVFGILISSILVSILSRFI